MAENQEIDVLKERIERLRRLHLKALAAFNAFEQMMEFIAPNILGEERAHDNAQAVGVYKGFLNTARNSFNTQLHISVAKLFDNHKDALHIEKLINYAEQNQSALTKSQKADLKDPTAAEEFADVYQGLDKRELLEIKASLAAAEDKIKRLKDVRDKLVAHENLQEPQDLKYLTFEEFAELIELSEKILNTLSRKYYGNSAFFKPYKDQVIHDSKALLKLVGDKYDERNRDTK